MTTNQYNTLIRTQRPQNLFAMGYEQLTVTGASPQALTVPSGAVYAEIKVESATTTGYIMYFLNLGTTILPTTSTGIPLSYGDYFDLNNGDLLAGFRVIAVSGSHKLNIQYFKY
jgi:hypothetical protein